MASQAEGRGFDPRLPLQHHGLGWAGSDSAAGVARLLGAAHCPGANNRPELNPASHPSNIEAHGKCDVGLSRR